MRRAAARAAGTHRDRDLADVDDVERREFLVVGEDSCLKRSLVDESRPQAKAIITVKGGCGAARMFRRQQRAR